MGYLLQWFINNLEFIFFLYGITYIVMGVAILVQPKRRSSFKIAGILWLFVTYAFINGVADFIQMWSIIKESDEYFFFTSNLMILASHLFLFEFGRRIFKILKPNSRIFKYYLLPLVSLLIIILTALFIFFSKDTDFYEFLNLLMGYFIGIPGGIMAGVGIIIYYNHEKNTLKLIKVKFYFLMCGYAILAWTFLFAIIRTKGAFFPSNDLNIEMAFMLIKIPSFILRSICGIIVAWSFTGIISIFNWETEWKIRDALRREKESRDYLSNIFMNLSDSLIVADHDLKIKKVNDALLDLLGYCDVEIIGKPLEILFDNNFSKEDFFNRLLTNNFPVNKETQFITKRKKAIPIIFSYTKVRKDNPFGKSDIVAVAKDITERKWMEKAIRVTNEELNIKVKARTEELEKICSELEAEVFRRNKAEETLISSYLFLQAIIDGVADPILVIDADYEVKLMNRAAKNNFLLDDDLKLSGIFCYKVSHHRDSPCSGKEHPCLLEHVKSARRPILVEHKHFQANGDICYVEILASPLFNEEGGFQGIIETMRDITERKYLEKEIINISEMERQRIGQDLHDDLAQNLVAVDVLCKMLKKRLEDQALKEARDAEEISKFVQHALHQTRQLARGLCPVSLEPGGFVSAMQNMAEEVESIFKVVCKLNFRKHFQLNDTFTAIHLYHIVREAIMNTVKHANAKSILIDLNSDKDFVTITVKDDGVGIPQKINRCAGLGLRIMNYRAHMINAALDIRRDNGRGTIVTCSFNSLDNII